MNGADWQLRREAVQRRVQALREEGICYVCHDLATGEVFEHQELIYEDDRFRVILESFPRMPGHTVVVYKPHREDISHLSYEETAEVFCVCVRIIQAIKAGLGADKVYLNTMCDGGINHLHIQLFPRYPEEPIGSKRFVAPRGPLRDGARIARRVKDALDSLPPSEGLAV